MPSCKLESTQAEHQKHELKKTKKILGNSGARGWMDTYVGHIHGGTRS